MTTEQQDKSLQIDPEDALELGRCMHKIAHALDGTMFTRAEALALFGFLDSMMFMLMDEHKADLRQLDTWVHRYDGEYDCYIEKEEPAMNGD
jgi:hypothetical protein